MSHSRQRPNEHAREVLSGKRFEFGRNWARFLESVDESRIAEACHSLEKTLRQDLQGKTFLDVGSGSGLFSLAARRLGAKVYSFDYDPQSVACTRALLNRYFPSDPNWTVEQASALDTNYLSGLGKFDVVYSWGVLHHTGALWQALENVLPLVAPGGALWIAIYNDQGRRSRRWMKVKSAYNRLHPCLRFVVLVPAFWHLWGRRMLKDLLLGKPFASWREAGRGRGMSAWVDFVDWVGGYPFEVAKPEEVVSFCQARGFTLIQAATQGADLGCNEFVFCNSRPTQ